jgi:hypothetical protein
MGHLPHQAPPAPLSLAHVSFPACVAVPLPSYVQPSLSVLYSALRACPHSGWDLASSPKLAGGLACETGGSPRRTSSEGHRIHNDPSAPRGCTIWGVVKVLGFLADRMGCPIQVRPGLHMLDLFVCDITYRMPQAFLFSSHRRMYINTTNQTITTTAIQLSVPSPGHDNTCCHGVVGGVE